MRTHIIGSCGVWFYLQLPPFRLYISGLREVLTVIVVEIGVDRLGIVRGWPASLNPPSALVVTLYQSELALDSCPTTICPVALLLTASVFACGAKPLFCIICLG